MNDRPRVFTPPDLGKAAAADALEASGHGSDDQSPGHTLMSAAKAQVEAVNISNDYLKQIQMDISNIAANYGFE